VPTFLRNPFLAASTLVSPAPKKKKKPVKAPEYMLICDQGADNRYFYYVTHIVKIKEIELICQRKGWPYYIVMPEDIRHAIDFLEARGLV